jgi:hypothetical protein
MKLETELTIEDILAFNRYHSENSRFTKRSRNFISFLAYGIALLLVGITLVDLLRGKIISAVINIVFIFLLVTIARGKFTRYIIDTQVRSSFKEGKNKGLVGHHEITISDDTITEESDSGSCTTKWGSVERIIRTEKYIFIYISSFSAFLIPRRFLETDAAYNELYNLILSKKDTTS